MKTKVLSNHIVATYKALRLGVALIALAFPLILWIGGQIHASLPLQGSMSAYYHAGDALHPGQGAMRNEFVGILFAIGVILFLYQGISRIEDYALNLAGGLALGVALFPMKWPVVSGAQSNFFFLHGACAVSFFVCIAIVCIFCASDTLDLIKNETKRRRYRRSYLIFGALMILLPFLAACLKFFAPLGKWTIFFVEVSGIYVFAAYWLLKSYEISQTGLDKKAALGKLRIEPRPLQDTLRLRPMSITPIDDQNVKQQGEDNRTVN